MDEKRENTTVRPGASLSRAFSTWQKFHALDAKLENVDVRVRNQGKAKRRLRE